MSFLNAVLIVVAVLGVGGVARVIIGPTIWDRILGLNLISSKIIVAIVFFALILEKSYLLDIAIVYSLIGFIGSVLISRFVEKKGQV
ncbi:MAG: pH regulation protein F [Spirochaetaceae bacterium]|nr:MAG: pH regulation protein F [Spirochaetaceae bacterium]